jgi:uncharacterized protein DUF3489
VGVKKASGKRRIKNGPRRQKQSQSKKSQFVPLLQRSEGATINDLMAISGWQAHSVRGFLSGVVVKKMGMKITSEVRDEGQRVYRISFPAAERLRTCSVPRRRE